MQQSNYSTGYFVGAGNYPVKPQPINTLMTSNQIATQQSPTPQTLGAYMIGSPVVSAPNSNNSTTTDSSATSSFSNMQINTHASSPQAFNLTPTAMPNFQPLMQNVVCSPGPVMYNPQTLQSATYSYSWALPPNLWQPVQPVQYMVPQQQVYVQDVDRKSQSPEQKPYFVNKDSGNHNINSGRTQKVARTRCKACCRNSTPKNVSIQDIKEATKERPELMKQLPEFFGEPQLNFEEFVHYAPVFRMKSLDPEMQYFKIPRTTKERELNIPRRLCELFVRTFGPEDAPDGKDFERISPHTHLCDARMAVRSSIVKSLPKFIIGCKNMEEANNIFDLIFRFTGVAMVKSTCNNPPQVFTSFVEIASDKKTIFECTGIVSLFNYHLFRRRLRA